MTLKKCICQSGLYRINGVCQVCPLNTRYDSSTLQCVNICSINETYVNGYCQCLAGYFKINGLCQICPTNSYFNSTYGKCISYCTNPN